MGQLTADRICVKKMRKTMDEVNSIFRTIHDQAFLPGHYYKGAEGVVIKVVRRTPSGKTVYITTHIDDDNPFTQAKRVKISDDGYEYICYKNNKYVIGVWNETDSEAFRRYINAHIGEPIAVI